MIKARNHEAFGLLQPIDPTLGKWQVITIDFITPLPLIRSDNSAILTVVCKLSKIVRFIQITNNISALKTALIFKENVYRNHGLPEQIISDRALILMSNFCKFLFKTFKTKLSSSSAYHPETNDQSKIMNRKLEEMMRAFANYNEDNWDVHLVEFEVAYNSTVSNTTLWTSFYMNYVMNPKHRPIGA